jgi:hypothetical protein
MQYGFILARKLSITSLWVASGSFDECLAASSNNPLIRLGWIPCGV